MKIKLINTTEAALRLGVDRRALLDSLLEEKLIDKTVNRHYRANLVLIRMGLATSGDLKWTEAGMSFLKRAYQKKLSA